MLRNVTAVAQTVQLPARTEAAAQFRRCNDRAARDLDRGGGGDPPPHLWAPGSPKLYRATLELSDSQGNTLRRLSHRQRDPEHHDDSLTGGELLNGRLLNLRGVDLHEQDIATGAALNPAQLATRMAWIRKLGASIRAHYPLSPQTIRWPTATGS